MFRRFLFGLIIVASALSYIQCCHSFGEVLAEITPKHGNVFKKTIRGCISRNSLNITDVAKEVKIINQTVTQLKIGAVENMASLTNVQFIKCNIQTLNARSFRNVPVLTTIWIHYSLVETIPKNVFSDIPNLKKIYLSHNKISTIENGSFDIPTLQILQVPYNKLKNWNKYWFSSFRDLNEIDFRDNLISALPSNAFENFDNLTKIIFNRNMITHIEIDAFAGLSKLKNLGLTYNMLTEINVNWFPNRINLSKLTVNANRLNYISLSVLQKINPKQILLDGNPWKCNCWKDVIDWMHKSNGQIVTTDDCENSNVPVCVGEDSGNNCVEAVDRNLTEKYFDEVMKSVKDINSVKRMKCYRFE